MLVCQSAPLIQSPGRGSLENTDELSNVEKTTEGVMRMRLLDTASAILPPLYSVALSSEHDRSGEPRVREATQASSRPRASRLQHLEDVEHARDLTRRHTVHCRYLEPDGILYTIVHALSDRCVSVELKLKCPFWGRASASQGPYFGISPWKTTVKKRYPHRLWPK